mmetsp:Transcript_29134/g.74003  ORF Transcript_29134/g.74003 Transcript_29134/m.74003 type:complete len:254 (+) Transcript_29134:499-1260(+)
MDLEVERGLVLAEVLLEVIHPPQGLLDAPRCGLLSLLDIASLRERALGPGVDDDNLPVGPTLIDEADRTQRPALDDLADARGLRSQVQDVQRVVVARGAMDLIFLQRVPERLREAAVVERHGLGEGTKPRRALLVLPNHVAHKLGLDLELLERSPWDLVDKAKGPRRLVAPVADLYVHVVPQRGRGVRRRRVHAHSWHVQRQLAGRQRLLRAAAPQDAAGRALDLRPPVNEALRGRARVPAHRCRGNGERRGS